MLHWVVWGVNVSIYMAHMECLRLTSNPTGCVCGFFDAKDRFAQVLRGHRSGDPAGWSDQGPVCIKRTWIELHYTWRSRKMVLEKKGQCNIQSETCFELPAFDI